MTSTPNATLSIESTTALLQAELPRLEEHQQALQTELATVSERLESVRAALSALSALSATTVPQPRAGEPAADAHTAVEIPVEAAPDTTPEPAPAAPEPASVPADESTSEAEKQAGPRKTTATATATGTGTGKARAKKPAETASKRRPAKKTTPTKAVKTKETKSAAPAAAAQETGGLTDQVIAVLARHADTPLRARDVAQALGRDDTTAGINTVRSTLDRLIATSRAHRAGRGLYQAPTN
ncbi:hypothetical protein ACWGI8_18540 [Streptomyces sp. NPDC054841]